MIQSAPNRIQVQPNGEIACPLHGSVTLAACGECPALHGTLEGQDVVILCGARQDRPALSRRVRPAQG